MVIVKMGGYVGSERTIVEQPRRRRWRPRRPGLCESHEKEQPLKVVFRRLGVASRLFVSSLCGCGNFADRCGSRLHMQCAPQASCSDDSQGGTTAVNLKQSHRLASRSVCESRLTRR